jgi:predicted ATPase
VHNSILYLIRKRESFMKKIIALAALAFLLTAGTAVVMTVHPQLVMACPTTTC